MLRFTGRRVVAIRPMTDLEREMEGWETHPEPVLVAEYDDGVIAYPACEHCDRPGVAYAQRGPERWKLEPYGELDVRPEPYLPHRIAKLLVISVVTLIVLNLAALALQFCFLMC